MNPHPLFAEIEKHLKKLISIPSISPHDKGCQDYIQKILEKQGFTCLRFPKNQTDNLYAEIGTQGPLLIFAGHTDVVESGPENLWKHPPFKLTEHEAHWYGRGVADMKGAIAAILVALAHHCPKNARVGILLTSAEEGSDYNDGTPYVMQELKKMGKTIDYCLIGEPSSAIHTGDTIKIGRRGSLNATAAIHGKQGHVAYPHLAQNAIHLALPFLNEISHLTLDEGNSHFPPSSLQITRLSPSTQAQNVIPGALEIDFNIRFNPLQTSAGLQDRCEKIAKSHQLNIEWNWRLSGEPFFTESAFFINLCQYAIQKITQNMAQLSTSGGTSDGRFIAPYGVPVIELGLPHSSIHQIDENIKIEDILLLTEIYIEILKSI